MPKHAQASREERIAMADRAVELFVQHGFDAVTADDIARASGISRRTFFRYFTSKEGVFFARNDARMERLAERVRALRARRGAWGALRQGLLDIASDIQADAPAYRAWRQALYASPKLIAADLREDARWESLLAELLREGGRSPDEAAAWAGALMGVVRSVFARWADDPATGDLVLLGNRALSWLEQGLR